MTKYYHFIAVVISILIGLCGSSPSVAEINKTIITAGPSWERFTNEDGGGLYHDIIREIFAGYKVEHLYVPAVQANSMVAIGRADIKLCETKEIKSLVLASIPMYENDFYALFIRKRIEPIRGDLSLKGKKVVWIKGYYSNLDFTVPVNFIEVRSGESALKMVVHGRADFYIDDLALIRKSFDDADESFDPEKFGLEKVGTRQYFPVFADTPRGKAVLKHYELKMQELYKKGDLQRIYHHWNFPVPNFKFIDSGK